MRSDSSVGYQDRNSFTVKFAVLVDLTICDQTDCHGIFYYLFVYYRQRPGIPNCTHRHLMGIWRSSKSGGQPQNIFVFYCQFYMNFQTYNGSHTVYSWRTPPLVSYFCQFRHFIFSWVIQKHNLHGYILFFKTVTDQLHFNRKSFRIKPHGTVIPGETLACRFTRNRINIPRYILKDHLRKSQVLALYQEMSEAKIRSSFVKRLSNSFLIRALVRSALK